MSMPTTLRIAFEAELAAARAATTPASTFRHLERAHVLSQVHTGPHVRVHGLMLQHAWRQRDWREVAGQLLRIPAALLMSAIWVPIGNTGGANVSAIRPMPLPEDLAAVLAQSRN